MEDDYKKLSKFMTKKQSRLPSKLQTDRNLTWRAKNTKDLAGKNICSWTPKNSTIIKPLNQAIHELTATKKVFNWITLSGNRPYL